VLKIALPEFVEQAINTLQCNGYEAYAVGGCVRDSIRGVCPADWDVCTSAKPHEIIEIFSNMTVIATGMVHGTVTVLFDKTPVEITTFRIDGEYKDNRHPDKVSFTNSLELDLSRRDFTINAMAYCHEKGIIDPFDGKKDLKNKIIRCVGNPEKRFDEDALRILRALRFSSVLSFDIEKDTKAAILKKSNLLLNIAAERINVEFTKLLCGANARKVLFTFRDIVAVIIPETKKIFDFDQKTKYHIYDIWQHTLHALNNIQKDPVLRLTMLLHDIGKPFSFTQDLDGTGHFFGHPEISCQIAREILKRLRYDNHTIQEVCLLIKYHDSDIFPTEKSIIKWLNKVGADRFNHLIEVKKADNMAQNPEFSRLDEFSAIESLYNKMKEKPLCYNISHLAVNGHDLMDIGITDGHVIGKTLDDLLRLVMSGDIKNSKINLLEYIKNSR